MRALKKASLLLFLVFCISVSETESILAQEDCPRVETVLLLDSNGNFSVVNRVIPCDGEPIVDQGNFGQVDGLGTQPERDYSTANPHVDPDEISIVISAYNKFRRALEDARAELTKVELSVAELRYKSSSKKKIYAAELKLNKLRAYERKLSNDLCFLSETIFIMLSNHATKDAIQMIPTDN